MSDEVRTGKQAREDTFMALLEVGAMKGMFHRPLESVADVDKLYDEFRRAGKNTLSVLRIPREVAERGLISGASCGLLLAGMPENMVNATMLTFDGWADDPRELFETPCVVDFCRGLLYGHLDPNPLVGRAVLPFIAYEPSLIPALGKQRAYDTAGQLWVCGAAHPDEVYVRSAQSRSGWLRDVSAAEVVRKFILEGA